MIINLSTLNAELSERHPSNLNTPRQVYDDQQQLRWKWDQQEPFANSAPDENPSALGVFEFDLGFLGQRRSRETGLFYNGQRDGYNPTIGAYTQPEPIGLAGDINLYRYGRSSPLLYVDPTGENPVAGASIGGALAGPPGAVVGGLIGLGIGLAIGNTLSSATGQSGASLAPPGKCTPTQHRRLQDEVDAACKIKRSCDPGQSCPELLDNYYKNQRCAQARDEINNTCFGGGNAGHRQAANDARNAAQRCLTIMQQRGCSNCPVVPNK